jgi:hypothetical protein
MPIMIYRATYSFHTNGNDKDWDSQVGIDLVSNGSPVGSRYDFNHDHNVDHWNNDSDEGPWDCPLSQNWDAATLAQSIVRFTLSPNGSDTWECNAFLTLYLSDQSTRGYSWPNLTFVNHDSKIFQLHP